MMLLFFAFLYSLALCGFCRQDSHPHEDRLPHPRYTTPDSRYPDPTAKRPDDYPRYPYPTHQNPRHPENYPRPPENYPRRPEIHPRCPEHNPRCRENYPRHPHRPRPENLRSCGDELKQLNENVTKILTKLDSMQNQMSSLSKSAPDNAPVAKDEKIDLFLKSGLSRATNPIKRSELSRFARDTEKIKQEYESVPEGQYYRWNIGKSGENFPAKHRYDFSKAYDYNRVVLKVPADNVTAGDYINANYIDGIEYPRQFIATQAPIPATVNDHWRMIMDTNSAVIVTLTKLVENNKTKCEKYWADDRQTATFGDVEVTTRYTEVDPDYDIRHYVARRGEETREIKHYHFLSWPDNGTPDPKKMIEIISRVRNTENYKPLRPVIVHCSAGVGRTGTFILLTKMLEMAEKTGEVDVYKHFAHLRTQRVNAIETLDQYKFIYETLTVFDSII